MKNTYLNIRYGGHRAKLSVLLTALACLVCSTQVQADDDYYTLKGSFDSWGTGYNMPLYPDGTYKATFYKSGDGDIEFKIQYKNEGQWYGKSSDNSVTREGTISGLSRIESGGNCKVAGAWNTYSYTIEWNANDKSVNVVQNSTFGVTSGQTVYFDATNTGWSTVKLNVGRADAITSYSMNKVSGTRYLYSITTSQWDNAAAWCISNADVSGNNNIYNYYSLGNNNSTCLDKSTFTNNYVYPAKNETETVGGKTVYKWDSRVEYSTYAVTITNGGNGTITVKDYDNTTVASGTNKSYLTVLKVTVTPDAGYVLGSLSIGGTDYTAAARSGEVRHTMTAATAVNVTFRKEPTVLIAEDESTSDDLVTLNGYVEYTGCLAVTEYGFVYGTGATPTTSDTKVQVGTSVLAGTHYTKTFTGDDGIYYYRAYIIAGGNTYYSTEIRTFTVSVACDVTSVNAQIAGGTSASAQRDESVALTSTTHADVYLWECTSANSASATITNSDKRNASVSASATGTYTFKLKAKCTGDASYAESAVVTLYVCDPATAQTVYLDNHTANVICEGETATATCISQTGYTYSLYHGDDNLGSYTGTGATLTWYNVSGEGTFYVKSSPDAMPQCAVTVGSATQSYNIPTVDITTSPGLSVIGYKDVTLTKAGTSTVDTDLTWEITSNPGEKGYLLNTNRLHYDGRVRKSVVFKGGLDNNAATTYQVTGTGSKTVDITGSTDNKTCSSSGVVTITVSPATETCN